ncbi:MAG: hypothetical protein LC663_06295 [Actinobacteria bacterium]|nr:hypothetical protein [Actinomycetota bacterium]
MRAHVRDDQRDGGSPLGEGRARLLRAGAAESAWLVDELPARAPHTAELLAIDHRAWAFVVQGEQMPGFEGLTFCRIVAPGGTT